MTNSPSIVVLASTMRSGSTLLKALLAEADDVMGFPEVNFQNPQNIARILSEHTDDQPPIKLLKKPCWYQESRSYPRLPSFDRVKTIVLVRDVYDTVVSLRKMTFRKLAGVFSPFVTGWLARVYWVNVTSRLIRQAEMFAETTRLVRYEDLVSAPEKITAELFAFVGSTRTTGTRTYSPPENYRWRWGSDDGSPNIRTLEVQPPRPAVLDDQRLLNVIKQCPVIARIRAHLGYDVHPSADGQHPTGPQELGG